MCRSPRSMAYAAWIHRRARPESTPIAVRIAPHPLPSETQFRRAVERGRVRRRDSPRAGGAAERVVRRLHPGSVRPRPAPHARRARARARDDEPGARRRRRDVLGRARAREGVDRRLRQSRDPEVRSADHPHRRHRRSDRGEPARATAPRTTDRAATDATQALLLVTVFALVTGWIPLGLRPRLERAPRTRGRALAVPARREDPLRAARYRRLHVDAALACRAHGERSAAHEHGEELRERRPRPEGREGTAHRDDLRALQPRRVRRAVPRRASADRRDASQGGHRAARPRRHPRTARRRARRRRPAEHAGRVARSHARADVPHRCDRAVVPVALPARARLSISITTS